jgi:hypothetical protein
MKTKKLNSKLVLRKQTIAALNLAEMSDIHGGICPPTTEFGEGTVPLCQQYHTSKDTQDTCGLD